MALMDISIHAAREGGDFHGIHLFLRIIISIHAAREGGDRTCYNYNCQTGYFNPRRP